MLCEYYKSYQTYTGMRTYICTYARYTYARVPFTFRYHRISRDNPARHSGLPDEQNAARGRLARDHVSTLDKIPNLAQI